MVRFAPLKLTMAPFTKLVPVKVTVKFPVGTGLGVMELIEGPAGSTFT